MMFPFTLIRSSFPIVIEEKRFLPRRFPVMTSSTAANAAMMITAISIFFFVKNLSRFKFFYRLSERC